MHASIMVNLKKRLRRLSPARFLTVISVLLAGSPLMAGAGPAAAAGGPLRATASGSGVRVTLAVSPGPYFLGELLPITVTLTNGSSGPVYFAGSPEVSTCSGGWIVLSGGTAPRYTVPAQHMTLCRSAERRAG